MATPEGLRWERRKRPASRLRPREGARGRGRLRRLPSPAARGKSYEAWGSTKNTQSKPNPKTKPKTQKTRGLFYRDRALTVFRSLRRGGLASQVNPRLTPRAAAAAWRERRDEAAGKLREKYAAKLGPWIEASRGRAEGGPREKQETPSRRPDPRSPSARRCSAPSSAARRLGDHDRAGHDRGPRSRAHAQQAGDVARAKETAGGDQAADRRPRGELQAEIDAGRIGRRPRPEKLGRSRCARRIRRLRALTALVWLLTGRNRPAPSPRLGIDEARLQLERLTDRSRRRSCPGSAGTEFPADWCKS